MEQSDKRWRMKDDNRVPTGVATDAWVQGNRAGSAIRDRVLDELNNLPYFGDNLKVLRLQTRSELDELEPGVLVDDEEDGLVGAEDVRRPLVRPHRRHWGVEVRPAALWRRQHRRPRVFQRIGPELVEVWDNDYMESPAIEAAIRGAMRPDPTEQKALLAGDRRVGDGVNRTGLQHSVKQVSARWRRLHRTGGGGSWEELMVENEEVGVAAEQSPVRRRLQFRRRTPSPSSYSSWDSGDDQLETPPAPFNPTGPAVGATNQDSRPIVSSARQRANERLLEIQRKNPEAAARAARENETARQELQQRRQLRRLERRMHPLPTYHDGGDTESGEERDSAPVQNATLSQPVRDRGDLRIEELLYDDPAAIAAIRGVPLDPNRPLTEEEEWRFMNPGRRRPSPVRADSSDEE